MTLKEWQILENIKTLSELAKRLKVAESSNPARLVQRWLNGESMPRNHHLSLILRSIKSFSESSSTLSCWPLKLSTLLMEGNTL